MRKQRFTDEQIANFLAQAKGGASTKFLCENYNFSASTLRRWKEIHDEKIRWKLKEIESVAAVFMFCIFAVSLISAVIFSRVAGAIFIPLMLGYCVFYIIKFHKVSGEFISKDWVFISRLGRGANNVFYSFSWIFVSLFVSAFFCRLLHFLD